MTDEELINDVMTTHLGTEAGKSVHQQCGEWQGRAFALAERLRKLIAEIQPRWIAVSERLPPGEDRYAVIYESESKRAAFIGDFDPRGSWRNVLPGTEITHWMPLPPLPEETK